MRASRAMVARKTSTSGPRIELFKELASAWLGAHGDLLASDDDADRQAGLRALSDLAYVSSVVADGQEVEPTQLAEQVRAGAGASSKKGRARR